MRAKSIITVAIVALATLAASVTGGACDTDTTLTCDDVCGNLPDCGTTSCLAYCISIQVACSEANASYFQDWASCNPTLACQQDSVTGGLAYTEVNPSCLVPEIGLVVCTGKGTPGMTTTTPGTDGGIIIPTRDAGHDSHVIIIGDDGGPVDDDGGIILQDGGDTTDSGQTTLDSGCGECQSDCVNECGDCTGGLCEPTSDDSGCGECQEDCVNSCGDCTGGLCSSGCVSTGCSDCTTDCEDEIACSDNCGNSCC
jgi:hypothetical protein